jgi:hypothetical protein
MKRAAFDHEINRILARLDQIAERDKAIIDPHAREPIIVNLDELFAYGQRFHERKKLHEELKALICQPIED